MAKIETKFLIAGSMEVNCYLLANTETGEALAVDPGADVDRILALARENDLRICGILLTHGHGDHMGVAGALKERTGAPVIALEEERELLGDAKKNLSVFIQGKPLTLTADEWVRDGQTLSLIGLSLEVIHTPGHTPGGCCYYCREAGVLFSGDTLFCGSVGRSDFPGGSGEALVRSVREKLFALPEETRVYPGHGEETTLAYEKKYNPFVQE